jgi:hypothetical protein
MANSKRNDTINSGPLPWVSPSSAGTASGLGTLGSRGDSWIGADATIDAALDTTAMTNTSRAAHRHRGPGSSRPFGKSRMTNPSKITPFPVALKMQAGHTTQLRVDAPASSPRTATKSARR